MTISLSNTSASLPSCTWWRLQDSAGTHIWLVFMCVFVSERHASGHVLHPCPRAHKSLSSTLIRSQLIVRRNIYYKASREGRSRWVVWPWRWHTFSHSLPFSQARCVTQTPSGTYWSQSSSTKDLSWVEMLLLAFCVLSLFSLLPILFKSKYFENFLKTIDSSCSHKEIWPLLIIHRRYSPNVWLWRGNFAKQINDILCYLSINCMDFP